MTLNDFVNRTTTFGIRDYRIYLEEDMDEIWDRLEEGRELAPREKDELCVVAFTDIQPTVVKTFLKAEIADAKVVRQFITSDRIYIVIRMCENES